MGILYIVPTPIGNLLDITLRALEVLRKVTLIAAEDTRETRKLLKHYEIEKPLTIYHEHDELSKIDLLIRALKDGDVALVSDAGTPGISDPGYKLVKELIKRDIKIIPLPGATAFVPALVGSGLATDAFIFLGFIGKKSSQRQTVLNDYRHSRLTLILYESPYRIVETLQDLLDVLGDRKVSISRELSKKFESFYRCTVSQAIAFFSADQLPGEMVIVVEGNLQTEHWDETSILNALNRELQTGVSLSVAAKTIAQLSGWKKSQIYQLGILGQHEN